MGQGDLADLPADVRSGLRYLGDDDMEIRS
jgi:hypothetical protein